MYRIAAAFVLIAALAAACGPMNPSASDATAPTGSIGSPVCTSGVMWSGESGPEMNPGRDCIGCHASSGGEAPTYLVAGTVYPTLYEKDNCYGTPGATVTITDANGVAYPKTSNASGNFYLAPSEAPGFAFPFSIVVSKGTATNPMISSQSNGACSSCHTVSGAGGAPGRILAP